MPRVTIEKNIAYDDNKKLYYVTMNYGKDNTGKRIKITKTYEKLKEAQTAYKKFIADKVNNKIVIPSSETLNGFIQYWLNDIKSLKCEETTIYGYKNIIFKHIMPNLGDFRLQDINPSLLYKYFKDKKEEGLSKNTIRKHYDLLKDVFKQAINEEKIIKNPLDKIEPIKTTRNEMNCYNIEQLKTLFSLAKNNRMEIVVKLAGLLALRREEIAGLKWRYVDLENKSITIAEVRTQAGKKTIIKNTKNPSSRRILSIPDEIIDILNNIKDIQNNQKKLLGSGYNDKGYIIAWENGEPYRPNYLSDLFKTFIDNNKLPSISLHDLRHSFASIANELGISVFDISQALGHSQVSTTTQIYTHSFDKTHEKIITKIANEMKKNRE